MAISKEWMCEWAQELGFAQTAFCSADGFAAQKAQVAAQPQLAERRQLRFSPRIDEPRGKSLAVMLWPYIPARMPKDEELFVDSYYYASNAAYHAARRLEEKITAAGHFAKANVPYPAKAAAVRAGLGWIGKNDLFFTERFGTRVVIILMLTDIEISEDKQASQENLRGCLSCGRCVRACPSGALDEKGMGHPERCMRNFMMEGVVVPKQLRERMGMRLIGCDMCQRVCPMQPQTEEGDQPAYLLERFVTDDPKRFSDAVSVLASEIGRNAARPQRVRAQAALMAGNSRNPAYLPVLRQWAQLPFEAVSEHAKWAIERLELERGGT